MYPNAQSLPRFFWSFINKQPLSFIIFFSSPLLLILETTIMPYALKMIIDEITTYKGSRLAIFEKVSTALWIYGLSWFFLIGGIRLQNWWQAYILPSFEADIRMATFAYILSHSYHYFSQQFAGNMASKIRDLPRAMDAIRTILTWSIISSLGITIATLGVMVTINSWCAIILGLWIFAHLSIILYFGRFTHQASQINAEDKNRLSGSIVDVISNITSVKLFSNPLNEINYIKEQQAQEIQSNKKLIISQNVLRLGIDIPVCLMMMGLLYVLIVGWQHSFTTVGDIAFVMQSSLAIMNHMWFLGQALTDFFREVGTAKQALSILKDPHEIIDPPNAKILKVHKGRIDFDSVTFHYEPGNYLFKDQTFTIKPGAKVGLVGFSGSGKTTLLYLILRFFELRSGQILIDNQNICEVTQDSLHEAIAMIPQDTTLFHRTLIENIRYGRPYATDEEVIQASIHAHCHEFITQLPRGYQTLAGERGSKLSGGQRQRIAIARAILKKAPIVILDEATSALDSITEKHVQESLKELMTGRTTIVIAHRLSTVMAMDHIFVFSKGQIVEEGTHDQLLQKGGHYAKMWHMQKGNVSSGVDQSESLKNMKELLNI